MKIKKFVQKNLTIPIALTLLAFSTFAQPGTIDPTFNNTDIGFGFGDGANFQVRTTSIQSDGKIIVGGSFISYNGMAINRIARLNTNGYLDLNFNPGTGANSTVLTTSIQSDGKIIIGGNFISYNGTAINRIARLNADGSLDHTFNPGTGASGSVETTSIQSDGKIIVGGNFTSFNGTAINRIARLNTDGSLDLTFNPGTAADGTVSTSLIQSDGKIIIGGSFLTFNGTTRNRIARLKTDGCLDLSFNPGTGANGTVFTTSIQSDGKIIIGGVGTSFNGTARNRIARLNTDGSLDLTFNPGAGADSTISTSSIQSDGKIIIGGSFFSYNGTTRNRISRLNTDGSLDLAFNPGTGFNNAVVASSIQSNGKIIIGGNFSFFNGTAKNFNTRLNTDGSLDLTFNTGTASNSTIFATSIQNDGKIIIGGLFTSYYGVAINRIARLNTDGSPDLTFNPGTGANNEVRTISIQSDGKIIVGGNFTSFNGTTRNRIARLNSDGSLDLTFNPGTGADSMVSTTSIQSDGKIIVGGRFFSFNGVARKRIIRLNTDGSLDPTFNIGAGANSTVETSAIQSNGKIIIGGGITSFNGMAINRIARLNTDGSLDPTFIIGTGANNEVRTTSIQSDGKIIFGGFFTGFNGTPINRIARLNTDGSLDLTFNPGTGANDVVFTTSIQSDGKIIVGGFFTTFNGTARNYITRLNTDGSLDLTFNPGTGASREVTTTSIQSDGKIIFGGGFTSYDGTGRNRIARVLNNTPLPIELFFFTANVVFDKRVVCNWSTASEINNDFFTIERSKNASYFEPIGIVKGNGNSSSVINYSFTDEDPISGISYYRLKQTDYDGTVTYSEPVAVTLTTTKISAKIFPNPATGNFMISLSTRKDTSCTIALIDYTGRTVLVKELSALAGAADVPVDVSNIAKGVYTLTLTNCSDIPESFKIELQ